MKIFDEDEGIRFSEHSIPTTSLLYEASFHNPSYSFLETCNEAPEYRGTERTQGLQAESALLHEEVNEYHPLKKETQRIPKMIRDRSGTERTDEENPCSFGIRQPEGGAS